MLQPRLTWQADPWVMPERPILPLPKIHGVLKRAETGFDGGGPGPLTELSDDASSHWVVVHVGR